MERERGAYGGKTESTGNLVEVKFFATLRLALGVASLFLPLGKPVTVKEFLLLCSQKVGVDIDKKLLSGETLLRGTMILVNGRNILHDKGLATIITPGDVVSLFPPAGGG